MLTLTQLQEALAARDWMLVGCLNTMSTLSSLEAAGIEVVNGEDTV